MVDSLCSVSVDELNHDTETQQVEKHFSIHKALTSAEAKDLLVESMTEQPKALGDMLLALQANNPDLLMAVVKTNFREHAEHNQDFWL